MLGWQERERETDQAALYRKTVSVCLKSGRTISLAQRAELEALRTRNRAKHEALQNLEYQRAQDRKAQQKAARQAKDQERRARKAQEADERRAQKAEMQGRR